MTKQEVNEYFIVCIDLVRPTVGNYAANINSFGNVRSFLNGDSAVHVDLSDDIRSFGFIVELARHGYLDEHFLVDYIAKGTTFQILKP